MPFGFSLLIKEKDHTWQKKMLPMLIVYPSSLFRVMGLVLTSQFLPGYVKNPKFLAEIPML
jgi:hypothetical protein